MYETEQDTKNAMDALNAMGYQVTFAKESFNAKMKSLQDDDSTNIYISNLPSSMDEQVCYFVMSIIFRLVLTCISFFFSSCYRVYWIYYPQTK